MAFELPKNIGDAREMIAKSELSRYGIDKAEIIQEFADHLDNNEVHYVLKSTSGARANCTESGKVRLINADKSEILEKAFLERLMVLLQERRSQPKSE